MEAIGPANTAAVAKNAKSSPVVSSPVLESHTPSARQLARAKSGTQPNQKPSVASVLPFSVSRSRPSEARVVKRSRASLPRPKDFRMRIPCTDSSTEVATSPHWSWVRRARPENRVRKREPNTNMGKEERMNTIARSGLHVKRITTPNTMVIELETSSTKPKDIHRRTRLTSVWARESSCPLCHESWKDTGRSCTWS